MPRASRNSEKKTVNFRGRPADRPHVMTHDSFNRFYHTAGYLVVCTTNADILSAERRILARCGVCPYIFQYLYKKRFVPKTYSLFIQKINIYIRPRAPSSEWKFGNSERKKTVDFYGRLTNRRHIIMLNAMEKHPKRQIIL